MAELKARESTNVVVKVVQNIDDGVTFIDFLNSLELLFIGNETQLFNLSNDEITNMLRFTSSRRTIFQEIIKVLTKDFISNYKEFPWTLSYKVVINVNRDMLIHEIEDIFQGGTKNKYHSNYEKVALDCLQFFIEQDYFDNFLWDQCQVLPVYLVNGKPIFNQSTKMCWNQLIKTIVSIPELVSNRLKLKTSSIFLPEKYFNYISTGIISVLGKVHKCLENSKDCSITFLSLLVSRICARGHAGILYDNILPNISKWVKESPLWCRICSKLFLSVDDLWLESVLEPMLKRKECLDLLPVLLDDEILKRPKLKFLLAHKMLFVKKFTEEIVPYSILFYLSTKYSREPVFKEVLFKLLNVWGDNGSMKSICYEQHLYLSKAVLISLSLLSHEQKKEWKQELTMKLLETVQPHLESSSEKHRILGMVVAECVTATLDQNGKQLNFELERTEELNNLYKLANNPLRVIIDQKETTQTPNNKPSTEEPSGEEEKQKGRKQEEEDLDSDDDFEPINVNNGVEEADENDGSVNGVKPPIYLRDCISGLLSSKDPNRLEACLNVVENLVLKEPGDLKDVAIETLRILLHLEDEFNINGFYKLRMSAMITITMKCPEMASLYLCGQFFEENYSISQRLDVLEVLSTSVTKLSSPVTDNPETLRKHLPLPEFPMMQQKLGDEKPKWREIIDERVAKKTRRFNSGKRAALPSSKNRLNDFIGSFFFPLLKNFGLNLNNCSELLYRDAMILGKYVYTLAVIMQAAVGLSIASTMGKSLLDFAWSLRFHKEAFVRQALIFALSKIILNVPTYILFNELQREIVEAKEWLQDLVSNDPDAECKKLAVSCYRLLKKTLQEGLCGNT